MKLTKSTGSFAAAAEESALATRLQSIAGRSKAQSSGYDTPPLPEPAREPRSASRLFWTPEEAAALRG